MELTISTRTPLWTGGAEAGKVDRIHETGILGSLRWWMEVLVRGVGGFACDPSQGTCRFDADEYEKSQATNARERLLEAGLCDVCQIFGATGWRRRFRLNIKEILVSDAKIAGTISLSDRQYTDMNGNKRTPAWYFRDPIQPQRRPNTPKNGDFDIDIQSIDSNFDPKVIAGLIQFIADWGALGARVQMGFGVIEPANGRIETQALYDWLTGRAGNETYTNLPSLQNIFLARISSKNGQPFREKDTFNLKYDLRRLFSNDKNLRHFIMGTIKDQRIAAKVKMSRPYNENNQIRVWGWIPEAAKEYQKSWNRITIITAIYQHLNENYSVQLWREMNSSRDSVMKKSKDVWAFLRGLL